MLTAVFLVVGCAVAVLGLAWVYFRRYTIKRAPIGVFNLADVLFMMVSIILTPFLYLLLPRPAVAALLAFEAYGLIYLVAEPVLRRRLPVLALATGLVGADLGAALLAGTGSPVFFAVNDLLLIVLAVGVVNLLAQSGLKARDAAVLGAFLIGYDFIATARLPLMMDLMRHFAGLPFSPIFAWPINAGGEWAGLGMGDVLLASVFPLVMRKAFGRPAGLLAVACSLATITAIFVLPLPSLFPVMIILGPLMVAQYLYWRFRAGTERTTQQYLLAEPIGEPMLS